jgi:23S rRNA (guanosine2251-2'-O)-methyltransferase
MAALSYRGKSCRELFIAKRRLETPQGREMAALARNLGLTATIAGSDLLDRLAGTSHHQGAVLRVQRRLPKGIEALAGLVPSCGPALVLALDHLEDPHNLGALMRSAAAFGAACVVAPKDRGAPLSQAARAASAGASEALDLVRVVNLPRFLKEAKEMGLWVVAADMAGSVPLESFEFPERCALVLGSEGRGLGREVARQADYRVGIGLAKASPVASLNVSNAGAILMHAWAKSAGIALGLDGAAL